MKSMLTTEKAASGTVFANMFGVGTVVPFSSATTTSNYFCIHISCRYCSNKLRVAAAFCLLPKCLCYAKRCAKFKIYHSSGSGGE